MKTTTNVEANVAEMDDETLSKLFDRYNEARVAWPEGSAERKRLFEVMITIGREMMKRH